MNPAQAMLADIELAGVVADDDGVGQKSVRLDAAPQGALGGERDGNGSHFERRDAELFEMRGPGRAIQEAAVRMFGQKGDHTVRPGARWRI